MDIYSIALIAHVVISATIIGLVLLQRGKGADAGAAFGSGASGTVFGAKGSANFLSRSTGVLATLFFLSSLGLAYMASNRPVAESMMSDSLSTVVEMTSTEPVEENNTETIDALPNVPGLESPGDDELLQPGSGNE